ncbi:hypothetical protein DEM27_23735 [Metarhizobium album]|uniref:Uncharacterized protein n=1 Tax=Metarhizobium album TaxID=2182425 RepID=A0A2U2DKT7_9HYPH|nr:hypothetical protein DEM27_23735 [Rhizobium album]
MTKAIPIDSPIHSPGAPDRARHLQNSIDYAVADLVDQAVSAGWRPREIMDAIASAVAGQRNSYEEDPDPADDTALLGG